MLLMKASQDYSAAILDSRAEMLDGLTLKAFKSMVRCPSGARAARVNIKSTLSASIPANTDMQQH